MKLTTLALLLAAGVSVSAASAASAETVTCSSDGHDHKYCSADTRDGVVLVDQLSRAGCWKGDTWGYDRRGIWVANGCRAVFRVGGYGSDWANSMHHNGSYNSSPDWRNDQDVDRWRDDESHKMTNDQKVGAAVGAAVVIAALAAAAKHEDDHHDNDSGYRGRDVVTCESRGQDHTYCSLGKARHVELKRQLSRASCQYNRSWGYDRHGIWVGSGCRAEFWVD